MGGTEKKKKRGGERGKARGFTRREKPTESEMKEGDARVGGRQGKTGEREREREGGCEDERVEDEGGETAR